MKDIRLIITTRCEWQSTVECSVLAP